MRFSKRVIFGIAGLLIVLIIVVLVLSFRREQTQIGQTSKSGTTNAGTGSGMDTSQQPKQGGLIDQFKSKLKGKNATPTIANSQMLSQKGALEIKGTDLTYGDGYGGYYVTPSKEAIYPGVVMIHEWWGLNDHIKEMADVLASHGYNVLAVDLYGGRVAQSAEEARSLVSAHDADASVLRMKAAKEYLKEQGSAKIGAIGWCFGGAQSLIFAINEPLDAMVMYYGTPVTETSQLTKIKAPVLGIFGDQDQSIPVATVNQFRAALLSAAVQNEIIIYPGVGHAFANPSGQNYAPEQTKQAWDKTMTFLINNLH